MKVSLNAEAFKFAGGAIIVGAAVCIMLPDLVKYVAGLWRLGVLIVAIIVLAWLMAMARLKLAGGTAKNGPPAEEQESAGKLQSSDNGESS